MAVGAAVALARPLEDWWICDHATSGGLDWPKLKLQMQSIAGWDPGVYGLKTQAHTELMMVLYARVDRWHRKDSDCPLGELSFRWLLLASQEQKNLLGSFKRVNSGKIENWLDSLLDAAWSDVWKLAAQWHEVLASGWPIFALMGLCSKKLRSLSLGDSEVSETCRGGEQLQRFSLALEEDGMLPAAALEKALESAAVQACAYARATVYVFAADMVRRGREEGLLLDLESGTEMLSKAQVAAHSSRALVEVINPWPLWKALDRFSCAGLVNVSVQQVPNFLPVRNWFWIFVSPTRANHQDQVISNSVRAKQLPYCSREFRNSLAQVASQAPSHWQPRIVEVGAHFGDCMLWAAAAIPGVRCLGIEADLGRWQRFQRSVVANNFQDNIQAIRALAGSSEYKDHTEFEGSQLLSFVPGLALDDVWSEPLDVLKIHINGGEHLVLKGARRIFELGVKAVVVSCKNHTEMFRVVHFLLKYDYDMQISGEAVNASLRGNGLLRHIEEIIQETGRKHLQAMQRKTVTAPDRSGWVVFEKFQLNSNML
ncbi:unnamed protein product [Cladocopium goreaui]|uniref:Methyltransferase FkbM domain-containing protein n=1 Tax=Cladocopium goreaui TaxID=2562237 RepID=A0A9P1BI21_9DINO|nr:unnamed protein product [Cladocopium goreaui]